jgi:beta-galactosidase
MRILKFLFFFLFSIQISFAQLEATARGKITELEQLISEAESENLDVIKEKMTIRVAEVYLKYANWDAANVSENTDYFAMVSRYKNDAAQNANDLPDFERSEIILMLDEAIALIKKIKSGEVIRKEIPRIDWAKISIEGNELKSEGKTVFLEDYTWKPYTEELNEFFGQRDGFYLSPTHITNNSGSIKSNVINDLNSKRTGTFGSMFINHKNVPNWAEAKYGPGFKMREDTYTAYDIDNPGSKEMMGYLLGNTIPKMVGKNYVKMGYMLTNEPHFFTTKDGDKKVWASGPVSEFSKVKFRTWLLGKHNSISELNSLWSKNFTSFDELTIDIPIEKNLQGTPIWYDWQSFNFYRVTEWFKFLQSEVKKHDSNAKTHIKIMPNLWSNNGRDHGIDFETLIRQSDIIGNDAGCHNNYMWGGTEEWEEHYNFEWRELCMSYDFVKSVSPNKINYNSEGHFLSTVKSRDLYQKPSYARMTYWLAYVQGLNVVQTWFWARRSDGSIRNNSGNGYAGSNNQQPRIINEVTSTLMDLNSYADEITVLQNLRKSIRIFDSKTSAINKSNHMDSEFELYESLFFEGLSIGFATENIIKEQDNTLWDVVLIYDTEFATEDEIKAVQTFLDKGGKVIMDTKSFTKDEYGRKHILTLTPGSGSISIATDVADFNEKAIAVITSKNRLPNIIVSESNDLNHKGCTWKSYTNSEGNEIISIVNIGKKKANITLSLRDYSGEIECKSLLNGSVLSGSFEMEPEVVLFLEVSKKTISGDFSVKTIGETCTAKNNGSIEIIGANTGSYKVVIGGIEKSFDKDVLIENLSPATYDLCIENLKTSKKNCYSVKIEKASELIINSTVEGEQIKINIDEGTQPFRIFKNGIFLLKTKATSFKVEATTGDVIEVKSDKECEGNFIEKMKVLSRITPNPVKDFVNVFFSSKKEYISIDVYNMNSKRVANYLEKNEAGKIKLDLTKLEKGVYFVRLNTEEPIIHKVIKN